MNGHAASTRESIEFCKASYQGLFTKFDVNWSVKSSILENDDELMMLQYFRVCVLCEHVHVLAFAKPVSRTLVINLHMLGIVGPSPNFFRHFRAIAFVLELNLQ